ncbi:aldehyde dehydrogenase (NAD+) [Lysinibacillus composti]|nr:aldehyde dehydrogenase (NAD+) [Lysinibacillus composti]
MIDVTVIKRIPMLIDGRWVGDDHDEWLPVNNPSTGEKLTEIVNGTKEHVDLAVKAARKAFESDEWRAIKPFERGQLLIELAAYIREHAEEWSLLECQDVGKPLSQAKADIEAAARYFEFYGGAADKVMGDTIPIEDGLLNATVLEPVGITAHIVPWNYPIQITSRSVAAAIATGNAVIVKSAEDTPMTTQKIAEWFNNSRLPKGIFQHITGLGSVVGAALSSHPDINHITFTGSVGTGINVMQSAAKNVVPVTLELGGKSPNIVFADANLEDAVQGVLNSIIQNAGQTCSAGARLLVESSIKDEFLSKLVERFKQIKVGPGHLDYDMGPILNEKQFTQIMNKLKVASKKGQILCGGKRANIEGYENGYYLEPTIVDGLSVDDDLAQQEVFGPVLTVLNFDSVDEAIQLANSTEYGLVSGIWTKDIDVAHFVASRMRSGQVFINSYGAAGGIQMPFGGYKKSGIGREKGFIALRSYTQVKNIAIKFKQY